MEISNNSQLTENSAQIFNFYLHVLTIKENMMVYFLDSCIDVFREPVSPKLTPSSKNVFDDSSDHGDICNNV